MKRFFLVMVCSLIMTVFIAFNYLLWDRENKIKSFEDLKSSKNMSIEALGEKIQSLDDMNRQLKNNLQSLEEDIKEKRRVHEMLAQQIMQLNKELDKERERVYRLKLMTDIKPMESIIKKWVESIDKKQYETAYETLSLQFGAPDEKPDLQAFIERYGTNIDTIRANSIKLRDDEFDKQKKAQLNFDVEVDIKKVQGTNDSTFHNGTNQMIFLIDFDVLKGEWLITNIEIKTKSSEKT